MAVSQPSFSSVTPIDRYKDLNTSLSSLQDFITSALDRHQKKDLLETKLQARADALDKASNRQDAREARANARVDARNAIIDQRYRDQQAILANERAKKDAQEAELARVMVIPGTTQEVSTNIPASDNSQQIADIVANNAKRTARMQLLDEETLNKQKLYNNYIPKPKQVAPHVYITPKSATDKFDQAAYEYALKNSGLGEQAAKYASPALKLETVPDLKTIAAHVKTTQVPLTYEQRLQMAYDKIGNSKILNGSSKASAYAAVGKLIKADKDPSFAQIKYNDEQKKNNDTAKVWLKQYPFLFKNSEKTGLTYDAMKPKVLSYLKNSFSSKNKSKRYTVDDMENDLMEFVGKNVNDSDVTTNVHTFIANNRSKFAKLKGKELKSIASDLKARTSMQYNFMHNWFLGDSPFSDAADNWATAYNNTKVK